MRSLALALLCTLAPVLLAWWTGGRLARAADDPLLPELLLARQRRVTQAVVAAVLVMALGARTMLWWAAPALVVGTILAALPMRRKVFGERVGAGAYLEHALRALVGGAGPWLLLALTPAVIVAVPHPVARVAVAVTLGIAIVAWQWGFVSAWLACNVAAPLDRRDVEPLLRDVAVRSSASMPRLVRFGTPGIHLVNAYALPGVRVSTVAFSRRLLDTFPPEEIAAVFAHEMAHLEHFDPRRMRIARAGAVMLAAIAAGIPWLVPTWFAVAFPWLVMLAIGLRAQRSRQHETESDKRAVELLHGDGDVLARALVRLHLVARLPRRFDRELEASATHPSLARRVQSIHAAATEWRASVAAAHHAPLSIPIGLPPAPPEHSTTHPSPRAVAIVASPHLALALPRDDHGVARAAGRRTPVRAAMPLVPDAPRRDALADARAGMFAEPNSLARSLAEAIPLPVLLQSPNERVVVALGTDRVYWFDDVPPDARLDVDALREAAGSYRALRYADVTELRVAVTGHERHLLVRERTGEPRRVALHPGDVALAQRALDLVDGQLGHAEPEHGTLVARLVALALALTAPLGPGSSIATIVTAALVLWCPARPLLVALGAAAIAEATVGWLAGAQATTDVVVLVGQLLLAAIAIGVGARASAATAAAARPRRTVAALAVLAAAAMLGLTTVSLLVSGLPSGEWLDALTGTRAAGTAVGLLAALAGGLLVRRARVAPVAWTAAGAVTMAAATAIGGTLVVGARAEEPVAWRDVTASVVARHPLPQGSIRVLTSPSGRRWAVQRAVARGTPVAGALMDGWDWDLGSFAEGRTRTVRALQLEFLDDARVVVLARRGDSLEVRLEPAFAGEDPLPRRAAGLPALINPMLRVDRAAGTWHVAGRPRPMVTGRLPLDGTVAGTFEEEDDSPASVAAELAMASTAFTRPDTMIVAGGRVGSAKALVRRWVLPSLGMAALPLADGGVLYQEMPRFDATTPWRMMLGAMSRGTLWRLGPDGARTRIGAVEMLQCGAPGTRGEALCVERGQNHLRGLIVDGRGNVTGRVAVRAGWSFTRPAGALLAIAACGRPDVALLDAGTHSATRAVLGERACIADATPTAIGFTGIRAAGGGLELVAWRMPR
jgi:Zn-dependent protease with chaperone function